MASADVRAAVTAFFQAATIPGLNKVHAAPPYWADGAEWNLANELGSGAIAAVHLVEDSETRITVPAETPINSGAVGMKQIEYLIGLMLFYQYLFPSNTLTPHDPSAWAGPFDTIIDGCKARIRSDPNMGAPSVIWQAGQDAGDIRIQRDIPRREEGKVLAWAVIEFHLTELVTA